MKSFELIFVFLLSFFVLTASAFAQDGRRMSGKTKGTLIGAGAGGTAGAILGGTKGAIIGGQRAPSGAGY